jgi:hypothetical protein
MRQRTQEVQGQRAAYTEELRTAAQSLGCLLARCEVEDKGRNAGSSAMWIASGLLMRKDSAPQSLPLQTKAARHKLLMSPTAVKVAMPH